MKITFIIPTYNEEKAIEKTLTCLTRGLNFPSEIIVSDDKSTDNTVLIARKYTDNVLVPKEKHKTIAANRNAGAKIAKGEYLVFLDCDCTINDYNLFFTSAIKRFENDSNLVGLTGKLAVVPELETFPDKVIYSIFNFIHYVKNNILRIGESSGKFQMIRKSAFERVNGFREDLVTREDGDMFNRLSKVGRTFYDSNLVIFFSGRRAHQLGWPKLLFVWVINSIWFAIFDKAYSKEWSQIR